MVISSTKGGKIPLDKTSLQEPNLAGAAKTFYNNSTFPAALIN